MLTTAANTNQNLFINNIDSHSSFRHRAVGIDKTPTTTIAPKPPQKEKPISSLSLLLARTVRVHKPKIEAPTLAAPDNKFSCQNLLDVVSNFHETNSTAKLQLKSPLSKETLKLYAAEDDGTPDYELPEFEKGTNIMLVGVNEFAVVDTNSQVIHVRLSSDSVQPFSADDLLGDYDNYQELDRDSMPAHRQSTDGPDAISEELRPSQDESGGVHGIDEVVEIGEDEYDDDVLGVKSRGHTSTNIPSLRVGTWVRGSPLLNEMAVPGEFGGTASTAKKRPLSMERRSSPLHNSLITDSNSSVMLSPGPLGSRNDSTDSGVYISCRVSGSSQWSVAGRISMESRLTMNSFDSSEGDGNGQGQMNGKSDFRRSNKHYPSLIGTLVDENRTEFTSEAMSEGADADDFANSYARSILRPRRVLVSECYSDSEEEDELKRNQYDRVRTSSTSTSSKASREGPLRLDLSRVDGQRGQISNYRGSGASKHIIKVPKKFPLTLRREDEIANEASPSSTASSPSTGFFGEMSPSSSSTSPSTLVRDIDTGEVYDARRMNGVVASGGSSHYGYAAPPIFKEAASINDFKSPLEVGVADGDDDNYIVTGDDGLPVAPQEVTMVTAAMLFGPKKK